MPQDASLRQTLLHIARQLLEPDLPESEFDSLTWEWTRLCPHPGGTDILFSPSELGLCQWHEVGSVVLAPEDFVDFALRWEPCAVSMKVTKRAGGHELGRYSYHLVAPNMPSIHAETTLSVIYNAGETLAVALKGLVLPDGSTVDSNRGRILGPCTEPLGTRVDPAGWFE